MKDLKSLVDPNGESHCEYELLHKCKVWASSKGFWIMSSLTSCDMYDLRIKGVRKPVLVFDGKNELEAVSSACQWIESL